MDFQDHLFVGVDTHKNQHTAVVINCFHNSLGFTQTANDPAAYEKFIENLKSLDFNDQTLVFGLEDTQGLGSSLAQWLLDQGFTVKEVNPTITKRERKHSPNPDKSDKEDAKAIANALLSNWDDLPNVTPNSNFMAIRHLNNHRDSLVKQRTEFKNRLHNLLKKQYPNYKKFFSDPFGKTALAFWEKFPHPSELKHYGEKRLNKFLKNQAKSIPNDKAKTILSWIDKNSKQDKATEARNNLIPMIIKEYKMLQKHIEKIDEKIVTAVDNSEYKLTTMPGINYVLAAKIVSNIKNIDRFDSADELARYAGIAPSEYSSGKRNNTIGKKYGNRDLNHAFYMLAIQQIGANGSNPNPVAYQYYQKKLKEGKSKETAITCLQRRLVDIIYAMMRDRSAYEIPEIPEYEVLNKTG